MTKLWFNSEVGRWMAGKRELHCGDTFQLRHYDWLDVRIEMSFGEWYLIGTPEKSPWAYRGAQVRGYV